MCKHKLNLINMLSINKVNSNVFYVFLLSMMFFASSDAVAINQSSSCCSESSEVTMNDSDDGGETENYKEIWIDCDESDDGVMRCTLSHGDTCNVSDQKFCDEDEEEDEP